MPAPSVDQAPINMEQPPEAAINGVAGELVTFC
jgi:hypothetical protein